MAVYALEMHTIFYREAVRKYQPQIYNLASILQSHIHYSNIKPTCYVFNVCDKPPLHPHPPCAVNIF